MRFTFRPMTETDARAIHAWRYDGEYAIYNARDDDDGDLSEFLDPRSPYFAVYDETVGALVGFYAYGTAAKVTNYPAPALYVDDRTLCIGLGLRPDLTGQGKGFGLAFVQAGLDFARQQFQPTAFRLFVLTFNKRAIRVYERAGFASIGIVRGRYGEFLEMRRNA